MTHERHSDSTSYFAIDNVVREASEVCSMESGLNQMKSIGLRCCHSDQPAHLRLELLPQPLRHRVVTQQRLRHLLLDSRMVFDLHRWRPVSTRLQNSASWSG